MARARGHYVASCADLAALGYCDRLDAHARAHLCPMSCHEPTCAPGGGRGDSGAAGAADDAGGPQCPAYLRDYLREYCGGAGGGGGCPPEGVVAPPPQNRSLLCGDELGCPPYLLSALIACRFLDAALKKHGELFLRQQQQVRPPATLLPCYPATQHGELFVRQQQQAAAPRAPRCTPRLTSARADVRAVAGASVRARHTDALRPRTGDARDGLPAAATGDARPAAVPHRPPRPRRVLVQDGMLDDRGTPCNRRVTAMFKTACSTIAVRHVTAM